MISVSVRAVQDLEHTFLPPPLVINTSISLHTMIIFVISRTRKEKKGMRKEDIIKENEYER